jgi:fermentation-respiration switch protein FrsA (DUF1100 family)
MITRFSPIKSKTLLLISVLSVGITACASVKKSETTYDSGRVKVKIYQPSSRNTNLKKSTIIITPPTGGSTFLEHNYSVNLASRGFKVIRVLKWQGQDEYNLDLRVHKRLFEKAQAAIKTVIVENPSESFGILGTSVGGLHAAIALGRNPEIKVGVIIVAGAPLSEVIAFSDQSVMKDYREKRMKIHNLSTTEQYAKALEQTDLPKYPDYYEAYKNKQILFVLASEDEIVPTEQQEKLIRILSPEQKIEFESGHVWTILKNWFFHRDEITDFFDKSL